MAKIIYVCARTKDNSLLDKNRLSEICNKLTPDNISSVEHRIMKNGNVAYGIMNSANSILTVGNSVFLGCLYSKGEKWWQPQNELPDGSYALFRDGGEHVEIVSDPVASRTIWYYFDDDVFIASTSQRAIIMLLGSFFFDERVIPWIISTGSLGPTLSWDKRINRIPPNSSIIINKNEWTISRNFNSIKFNPQYKPDVQHEIQLKTSLDKVAGGLAKLDFSKWVLPLSGGYDSRGLLCLLNKNGGKLKDIKTITWGQDSAINSKGNDAYIAKKLSDNLGISNKYYPTNHSGEAIDDIMNRFLLCGEGRIDHLSGYMDGFKIWKKLYEEGVEGIIRGDVGFSTSKAIGVLPVKHRMGCALSSDYSNLNTIIEKYGFAKQEWPEELNKSEGESLETWRDRLYHTYRLPTILAALSDLKLSYVELINPLLSKEIISQVRTMPDHLRNSKAVFKQIVRSISPDIEFASRGANIHLTEILRRRDLVDLIESELSSARAKSLFPNEFLEDVKKGIKTEMSSNEKRLEFIKQKVKALVPRFVRKKIRDVVAPGLDGNALAFRVSIVSQMYEILRVDSKAVE